MSDSSSEARDPLVAAARILHVQLSESQAEQLLRYAALIAKWNRVYNLTAIRAPEQILTHHILDSLAIIAPLRRYLNGRRASLLDVGSGAGLPGVVIAACCSDISVTCVDAVAKKIAFVQQVRSALGLENLQGLHARAEALCSPQDVVVSRAFANLTDFVRLTRPSLEPTSGIWLAMKGKTPSEEIEALPIGIEVFHVEQIQVPRLCADRCLVWMRPRADQRESRSLDA